MKKIIYLMLSITLLFSCKQNEKKDKVEEKKEIETNTSQESFQPTNTYAVVWKWTTKDVKLMENNVLTINEELQELYKKGMVENVYYNADSKIDKLEYFPNITFFLKSANEEKAKETLNNLTIVKKQIANYSLHKVGMKMLGRDEETINKKGIISSFVSVWTTIKAPTETQKQAQFEALKTLYGKGQIENAYLDLDEKQNTTTDFVFFVNTNTKEEAEKILDTLPFIKENIASYKLHDVGVFWMGEYKK